MFPLFDFYIAKASIRIGSEETYDDLLIEHMVLEASAIVLNHCKVYDPVTVSPFVSPPDDPRWDDWQIETPYNVQAAARLVFGSLYQIREGHEAEILSQTVKDLLKLYVEPGWA